MSTRFLIVSLLSLTVAATVAPAQCQAEPETELGGEYADIAVTGSTVHWVHGMGNILYRRSNDDGVSWTPPVQIASGRIHLTDVLAADGEDVWVLYLRDTLNFSDGCCPRTAGNIYLRRSVDGGQTWLPQVQLTTSQRAFRISMAVSGSNVHIVWMDYRPGNTWDLYSLRSLDRGVTWQPEARLIAGVTGPGNVGAQRPRIAALGDVVHVAWMEKGTGQSAFNPALEVYNVFSIRSTDGGASWAPRVQHSPGNAHSLRSNVAVNAGGIWVVSWDDDRPDGAGGLNPFSRRSTDGGATWEPEVRISTVKGDHSTLQASDTAFFKSWHTSTTPRNIALSISRDGGASWEPTKFINSPAAGDRTTPLLAASNTCLHATWMDSRTGSWRSWHRRCAQPGGPTCAADWDGDGQVTSLDISAFLSSWLGSVQNGTSAADFNGDGAVNSADISAFVTAWIQAVTTGC